MAVVARAAAKVAETERAKVAATAVAWGPAKVAAWVAKVTTAATVASAEGKEEVQEEAVV